MQQLANAIALQVGFQTEAFPSYSRADYLKDQVMELRINSDLPEGTRVITSAHVAEAVAYKTQIYIDLVCGPQGDHDYFIVYINTPKIASGQRRVRYAAYHHAANAVRKANQFCDKPVYEVISGRCRMRRLRLKLVRSARDGALVLEPNDTSYNCAVASESYWAA